MTIEKLYKALGPERQPCHGGYGQWPEPGEWTRAIEGELKPCLRGYHLCRRQDLVGWLGAEIWEVEYRGEMVNAEDKLVVREARLVRKLETWTPAVAAAFAKDCSDRDGAAADAASWAARAAAGAAAGAAAAASWAAADAADAAEAADAASWAAQAAADAASWAAQAAAADAEREWQTERLFEYLEGKRAA